MSDEVTTGRIRGVIRDLNLLESLYPDLVEARLKGTPRPWREPTMSTEQRAAADRLAREERLERDYCPGERPAPLHIDVLDVLVDLLCVADETHEHVAQTAGVERLPYASSAFADPTPYLAFIRQHITAATEADPGMATVVEDNFRHLIQDVTSALALLRDGQTLKAPCFVCGGKTPETPVGGAFTLRVTTLPDETPAVVCRNPLCAPSEQDCGTWHRGAPAWPLQEWPWLADRIEQAQGEVVA